jgi:hypothetical protein
MAEGRLTDRNGRLLAHGTTTCLILNLLSRTTPQRGQAPMFSVRICRMLDLLAVTAFAQVLK